MEHITLEHRTLETRTWNTRTLEDNRTLGHQNIRT